MKNASMFFNALLLVLVAVLFFMYFSLKSSINKDTGGQSTANNTQSATQGGQKGLTVAYINDDSISANYISMSNLRKEMTGRQEILQGQYENKGKKLQQEYADYQQKAQSGNLSQIDAQKIQEDMQNKKAEVDGIQHQIEELEKEAQDKNIKISLKVLDYVNQYNKTKHFDYVFTYSSARGPIIYANNSMDITKDILTGLNKQYNDSISAKH